jgi:enoyl-CoA hydratase
MAAEVVTEHVAGVIIITLNRPECRNAVNRAVTLAVAAALDELDGRSDLQVAIITGAGGNFCSGMDLKAFLAGEDVMLAGRGLAGMCMAPPSKPVIAAVEGWALAGGCEIALACDLIVAASNAQFGIPEVKRGLVASSGGLLRLPRRLPSAIAMELALTGDPITAELALRYGLVNALTGPGKALEEALQLARRITRNGPVALAATKEVLTHAMDWPIEEAFARQEAIVAPVFSSEDAQEALWRSPRSVSQSGKAAEIGIR